MTSAADNGAEARPADDHVAGETTDIRPEWTGRHRAETPRATVDAGSGGHAADRGADAGAGSPGNAAERQAGPGAKPDSGGHAADRGPDAGAGSPGSTGDNAADRRTDAGDETAGPQQSSNPGDEAAGPQQSGSAGGLATAGTNATSDGAEDVQARASAAAAGPDERDDGTSGAHEVNRNPADGEVAGAADDSAEGAGREAAIRQRWAVIAELHAAGVSTTDIAERVGITPGAVDLILQAHRRTRVTLRD